MLGKRYGRMTADTEGVGTIGTAAILEEAIRTGRLRSEEAIDVLNAMIEMGRYCSTDLCTRIVSAFCDLNRGE